MLIKQLVIGRIGKWTLISTSWVFTNLLAIKSNQRVSSNSLANRPLRHGSHISTKMELRVFQYEKVGSNLRFDGSSTDSSARVGIIIIYIPIRDKDSIVVIITNFSSLLIVWGIRVVAYDYEVVYICVTTNFSFRYSNFLFYVISMSTIFYLFFVISCASRDGTIRSLIDQFINQFL